MFLSLPGSLPLVLSFERIPLALVRASFIFFVKVLMRWITFRRGMGFAGVRDFSPPLVPFFVSWEFFRLSSIVFVHVAQLLTEK